MPGVVLHCEPSFHQFLAQWRAKGTVAPFLPKLIPNLSANFGWRDECRALALQVFERKVLRLGELCHC